MKFKYYLKRYKPKYECGPAFELDDGSEQIRIYDPRSGEPTVYVYQTAEQSAADGWELD